VNNTVVFYDTGRMGTNVQNAVPITIAGNRCTLHVGWTAVIIRYTNGVGAHILHVENAVPIPVTIGGGRSSRRRIWAATVLRVTPLVRANVVHVGDLIPITVVGDRAAIVL
jgi:hypothetical protein